jgi:hypothetical protein
MNARDRNRLKKFHAMLGSPAERENAYAQIDKLLTKYKKTWNDVPELLSTAEIPQQEDDEPSGNSIASERPASLDLIRYFLRQHLHLTGHQFTALTLWIAHTFKYHRFSVTPRLALLSPVRGCGKTTVLNLISALAFKAKKFDHTTPAVLFRLIDREHPCILLDEADNQNLPVTSALRAVINSGHHSEGKVSRYLDGEEKVFSTFAPLGLAAIGTLPLPILHRSIVLRMERAPNAKLARFDPKTIRCQRVDCETIYRETFEWMRQCQPALDPPMPSALRNRAADNWRVLLAIADACSPEWGADARAAAIALSAGQDEDAGVLLLTDIRDIFRRAATDRLSSAVIVSELIDLPEGLWSEWRGPRDDQLPRKLSQGALALMLAPFGIKPRTIWPPRRGTADKSARGYYRAAFEAAWASYCDGDGTPSQASNIRYLDR